MRGDDGSYSVDLTKAMRSHKSAKYHGGTKHALPSLTWPLATAKIASTDTKVADPTEQARLLAKMEKQKTHLERTISDMSAARDRNKVRFNESNSRGGRGDSDRGDRDRSRDSRRSDDRR